MREKHPLVASHTHPPGAGTFNLSLCPDREWNRRPFGALDHTHPGAAWGPLTWPEGVPGTRFPSPEGGQGPGTPGEKPETEREGRAINRENWGASAPEARSGNSWRGLGTALSRMLGSQTGTPGILDSLCRGACSRLPDLRDAVPSGTRVSPDAPRALQGAAPSPTEDHGSQCFSH